MRSKTNRLRNNAKKDWKKVVRGIFIRTAKRLDWGTTECMFSAEEIEEHKQKFPHNY